MIAGALNERLGGDLPVSDVADMKGFSKLVDQVCCSDIHPVLCLDEFEEFTKNSEEFNDKFLDALRSLGAGAKLAMVTTSRVPLPDLIRAAQLGSPFYNIFSQLELGLLEPGEAQMLRREPFAREEITLSPENEALVEELGGRHPYFVQMACYYLYEALCQPEGAQGDVADVVRERFDRTAASHFEHLWDRLEDDKRAALRAAIGKAVLTSETEQVLKRLGHLGVVEKSDGHWRVFSATFARYVQRMLELEQSAGRSQGIRGTATISKTPVLIIGLLILLTLVLLIAGALTTNILSVILILLSAVSAGVLLFLTLWYRHDDHDDTGRT
jgi:hypothetical protein